MTSPSCSAPVIFNVSRVLWKNLNLVVKIITFIYLFDPAQLRFRWGNHISNRGIKSKLNKIYIRHPYVEWNLMQVLNVHSPNECTRIRRLTRALVKSDPLLIKKVLQALVEIYIKDKLDQMCFSTALEGITPWKGQHILPWLKTYLDMDNAS